MKRISFSFAIVGGFVALCVACGSNTTCKQGCDKVRACNLRASGLNCAEQTVGCTSPDNGCAQCLEDRSCGEIMRGACASACPGFTP